MHPGRPESPGAEGAAMRRIRQQDVRSLTPGEAVPTAPRARDTNLTDHSRNRRLVGVTLALAILLLVNAAFAVAVWPTFYRRVSNDSRARDAAGTATRFLTVHRVIVGVAYLIAAASAAVAIVSFF
jgi:hypothetical protein